MATWQEVHDYIHGNYKASDADSSRVVLGFQLDGGRSQQVHVQAVADGAVILVMSPIAEIDKINLRQLLMMTNDTPFGVACDGEMVVMQQTLLTATLDAPELEIALTMMTAHADAFEQVLTGGDSY